MIGKVLFSFLHILKLKLSIDFCTVREFKNETTDKMLSTVLKM